MLDVRTLQAQDLRGLSAEAMTQVAQQMLSSLTEQSRLIGEQSRQLDERDKRIASQVQAIKFKDAKLEKITFELARLKAWRFGAKTEAMNAEQRQMFDEAMVEDQASLEAQLLALQGAVPATEQAKEGRKRQPRRQALPEHLRRVEHHHEPENTTCPTPDCGRPMVRIGEDASERLDIVPAEFFVHRHIYGKWACRCCQRQGIERLVQEPADPQIIDGGIAASGLVAHTLISRFVDHLPYYRQETINARSGVHTPRSTLAAQSGRAGAAMTPLYEAHKRFVLSCPVLHADETPVAMLDPGAGKTKRAYIWAYARGELDAQRGVIYEFCLGRGSQYPLAFLGGVNGAQGPPRPDDEAAWRGTLVCDQYAGYDRALDRRVYPKRIAAHCAAHYLECCFIQSQMQERANCTRYSPGGQLGINPPWSTWLGIRSGRAAVCFLHECAVLQAPALRARAQQAGHPARVAGGSTHQCSQRAVLLSVGRPASPLLQRSRSE